MRIPEREIPQVVTAIAKNVRRIMKERQISGNKLAAMVKRPVMTVNDMVNGRTIPGADLLFAVADVLGVSADELRGKKPPQKKSA